MDWKPKAACAAALALILTVGGTPSLAQPEAAGAMELKAGLWQTAPTPIYAKLAGRIDDALAAQDPKPQVKTTKNKRSKTVTATVSCRALKAGVQKAKDKRARAYASLAMRLYAGNLYRDSIAVARVSTRKTIHGVNNYGRDRASDCSLAVGRTGTAEIYLVYEGILCTYKNGTFRKANWESEVYFGQTRHTHVASVEVPEGYRLKLQLRKRR